MKITLNNDLIDSEFMVKQYTISVPNHCKTIYMN